MDDAKESIWILWDSSSKRLNDLRETFRVAQLTIPPFRISRCGYFFYQAQETLNKGLGAFVGNDFSQFSACILEVQSHLDAVERILHKTTEHLKPNLKKNMRSI